MKFKIFSVLAFIIAAFYSLEIALMVSGRQFGVPILLKIVIVIMCLSYGLKNIRGAGNKKV